MTSDLSTTPPEPNVSPDSTPPTHLLDRSPHLPPQTLSPAAQSVEALARLLVDRPAQVRMHELIGQSSHLMELQTCKSDYGKLIGQRGGTASRLRHLLSAMSGRAHRRFLLELLEPDATQDAGDSGLPSDEIPTPDPSPEIVAALHQTLCQLVSRPQYVKIDVISGSQSVIFEVSVHPSDIKWVLGKGGEHIEALRGLLACIGAKYERRYTLLCQDPVRSGA